MAEEKVPTIVRRSDVVQSLRVVQPDGQERDAAGEMVLVETNLYRLAVERASSTDAARAALAAVEDYETQGDVRLHALTVTPLEADVYVASALFSWEPEPEPQRAL